MRQLPWKSKYRWAENGLKIRTMYRILAAIGESNDRRIQRLPLEHVKPCLTETAANQVWTWDITKLAMRARASPWSSTCPHPAEAIMKSSRDKCVLLDRRLAPVLASCVAMWSCGGGVVAGTDESAGGASGASDAGPVLDGNDLDDGQADRDGGESSHHDGQAEDAPGDDASPDTEAYEPLCDFILPEAEALSLWSSGDSVLLMVGATGQRKLFLKTPNGWQTAFQGAESSTLLGIRGRPDGAIFEYGLSPCGVRLLQDGASTCSAAASEIIAVTAPADDLAYAVGQHTLYAYDGVEWIEAGALSGASIHDVWADGNRVLVASSRLWWWQDDSFAEVPGDAAAAYTKVWVANGRIAAGTKEGKLVVHEGGVSTEAWASPCQQAVVGVWGENDDVFVLTRREFVRWRPSEVTVLSSFECDSADEYRSLWGSAANKVFIVSDRKGCASSCGCVQVEIWNGSALVPL